MTPRILILILLLPLALGGCGDDNNVAPDQPSANTSAGHTDEGEAGQPEGGHEAGAVTLTPEQIEAAGIELAQAGPARIRATLPIYGVIAPNAERVREVAARYPGAIRSVAKKIGDPVRQGETLAVVESNESLQTYAVVAPLTGVVTARNANPGEQTGDKALFTVADLSTVWVELSLFPRDVGKVRVGRTARVHSAEAGRSADGKVVYVAPFGSATSQTLTARVLLDNAARHWAPGLYVVADVVVDESPVAISIPRSAVQHVANRETAFVRTPAGFEPRALKFGRKDAARIEVLEGIAAGETVATSNTYLLASEVAKPEAEE